MPEEYGISVYIWKSMASVYIYVFMSVYDIYLCHTIYVSARAIIQENHSNRRLHTLLEVPAKKKDTQKKKF